MAAGEGSESATTVLISLCVLCVVCRVFVMLCCVVVLYFVCVHVVVRLQQVWWRHSLVVNPCVLCSVSTWSRRADSVTLCFVSLLQGSLCAPSQAC